MCGPVRRAMQTLINLREIPPDQATQPGALAFNWSEEVHYA
jgi:hypothetical protein